MPNPQPFQHAKQQAGPPTLQPTPSRSPPLCASQRPSSRIACRGGPAAGRRHPCFQGKPRAARPSSFPPIPRRRAPGCPDHETLPPTPHNPPKGPPRRPWECQTPSNLSRLARAASSARPPSLPAPRHTAMCALRQNEPRPKSPAAAPRPLRCPQRAPTGGRERAAAPGTSSHKKGDVIFSQTLSQGFTEPPRPPTKNACLCGPMSLSEGQMGPHSTLCGWQGRWILGGGGATHAGPARALHWPAVHGRRRLPGKWAGLRLRARRGAHPAFMVGPGTLSHLGPSP